MRRYLVTGAKGWLAGELDRRLAAFPDEYVLDRVSVRGDEWLCADWSKYDGVFHFASVVYGDDSESVNAELSYRVAEKCSHDNVPWLLVMSSFSVYGAERCPDLLVDSTTCMSPATPYGRSKLASEEAAAKALGGSETRLAIVRAPLVYGPGQRKGNFPALISLSRSVPFFPATDNKRSMIFSQNLCELCRLLADSNAEGVFLPQDAAYHDTGRLVRALAERQGRHVVLVPKTVKLVHFLSGVSEKLGKLFGNARYRFEDDKIPYRYRIVSNEDALDETVDGVAE
ncbi:NAD-dependent epimerase/dehydratase family protein [Collinsella tanakaei]|nr:NAD-dependent epimerase/dehydratase family protein [Collinsella tanakaei]